MQLLLHMYAWCIVGALRCGYYGDIVGNIYRHLFYANKESAIFFKTIHHNFVGSREIQSQHDLHLAFKWEGRDETIFFKYIYLICFTWMTCVRDWPRNVKAMCRIKDPNYNNLVSHCCLKIHCRNINSGAQLLSFVTSDALSAACNDICY